MLLAIIIVLVAFFIGALFGFKAGQRKASQDISEYLSGPLDRISTFVNEIKKSVTEFKEAPEDVKGRYQRIFTTLQSAILRVISIEFLAGLIKEETYWKLFNEMIIRDSLSEVTINRIFDAMEMNLDTSLFKHDIKLLRKEVLVKMKEANE